MLDHGQVTVRGPRRAGWLEPAGNYTSPAGASVVADSTHRTTKADRSSGRVASGRAAPASRSHAHGGGSSRALVIVFALLVVMTAVAAFAIGGLISLRSEAPATAEASAAAGRAPLAQAVGELATPDSGGGLFELLEPTEQVPAAGGALQPPVIGLTPAAGGSTPPDREAVPTPTGPPSASQADPSTTPSASPSCPSDPASPTSGSPGGSGAVAVVPLC